MTVLLTPAVTLRPTYSFYVGSKGAEQIRLCAGTADAVVIFGPGGPASVSKLRTGDWDVPVLFDRAEYLEKGVAVDGPAWIDSQLEAGADRVLTPGCWVGAATDDSGFASQANREVILATEQGATCVLAIDHRWLSQTRRFDEMESFIRGLDVPIALVLGDQGDPLRYQGSVDHLVALTRNIAGLTLLRIDHAGIGALAFDAVHASLGLKTSHRHAVPPGSRAASIPHDRTPRVFIPDLMDWFTVNTIGGWSTTRVSPTCGCVCCEGRKIIRFLDERDAPQADLHNRTVLADLAESILEVPESTERRRLFGSLCAKAIERYGSMGNLVNEIRPKAQLEQWATFA